MAETEEKVRETQVSQQGDTQVVRERRSTESSEDTRFTLVNGVWYLTGTLEVLLVIRLLLKLFGANPRSGFVDFIYSLSGVFTAPFHGIFSTPTTQGDITTAVFETSTVVALIVYALIGWGLVKLLQIGDRTNS